MPGDVRCGLIGLGRIGRRIATRLIAEPGWPRLVAALVRPEGAPAGGPAIPLVRSLDALIAARPTVVVECAGQDAVRDHVPVLLAAGIDVIPLSLAALADPATEERLRRAADAGPGRLEIPAGAMGATEFLAAAREDRLDAVTLTVAYPPASLRSSPAAEAVALDGLTGAVTVFDGPVREAARLYPRHLNVSVGVALAGLGLDRTRLVLVADPALAQATFAVTALAAPGPVSLFVGGRDTPLGADPVDYTTFSVLRLLRRRVSGLLA